ncbi:hypothetical protein SNEBB_006010 [Seison nebaliae]|nr:hypothetical protein SNEBB_006010 [Seison nebaliae]
MDGDKVRGKKYEGCPIFNEPVSDLNKWNLRNVNGRQTWYYGEGDGRQTMLEYHSLGMPTESFHPATPYSKSVREAAEKGVHFYTAIQAEDGHWAGDYGGPLFLMPGLIITYHVCGMEFEEVQRKEMIRYLRSVQCENGGWGLHIAGKPTVFGCTLNYVSMRLLGVDGKDKDLVKCRDILLSLGGAEAIPSWGKFWLCVANLYEYDGMHSILPELWLAPEWLPIHPSKMWCHCRQVYLPMSYCYGKRIKGQVTNIIKELRKEIFKSEYHQINWAKQRNNVAKTDLYTPHSWMLDISFVFLDQYEKYHLSSWRDESLKRIYQHIIADDNFTDAISIGPISKTINMLVRWSVDGGDSVSFLRHVNRVRDYLWMGVDGMKMTGTNGSQLWDTALAVQAILEKQKYSTNEKVTNSMEKAKSFLLNTQMLDSLPDGDKYYRHSPLGGFPFSTKECGWIVADCTAEGLKALLQLKENGREIDVDRIIMAIDCLLGMRNDDGGWATYEKKRGGYFLENLNPSEVFGDIMIDYTYTECTSAVIQAFIKAKKSTDISIRSYKRKDIDQMISEGLKFISDKQRPDGSFEGSWGICFTYGFWFAMEAFGANGDNWSSINLVTTIRRACNFITERQRPDGGWSEAFASCEKRYYIETDESQIIATCWALLGLMAVKFPNRSIIDKGIDLIRTRQLPNGDWPQEDISGVFNKSCAISYTAYRNVFPIWTLNRYAKIYRLSSSLN